MVLLATGARESTGCVGASCIWVSVLVCVASLWSLWGGWSRPAPWSPFGTPGCQAAAPTPPSTGKGVNYDAEYAFENALLLNADFSTLWMNLGGQHLFLAPQAAGARDVHPGGVEGQARRDGADELHHREAENRGERQLQVMVTLQHVRGRRQRAE